MYEEEAAPVEGQTVTVEDLSNAVAEAVAADVAGQIAGVSDALADVAQRVDGLSARVDGLSESVATQSDLQAVSASLAALEAETEQAVLMTGEIGPVLDEDVGGLIISLIGDLLDAFDTDGDGASDVASVVEGIRDDVQDIAATLVHPAMSTPFSDYSVVEACLLLLVFWQAVKLCLSMLRGGFAWLVR